MEGLHDIDVAGLKRVFFLRIPAGYDGKKAFPVILFLHGAGLSGTDGRGQVQGALGEAIRKQEKSFGDRPRSRHACRSRS